MGIDTKIQWAHHTFNPWWGCVRVSPGCVRCYAETFDRRVSGVAGSHWGATSERRFFGDKHWNEPLKWNKEAIAAGERRRVFCASMADVFEARADLVEPRARLYRLIEATPGLDWMLLTKRPENIGGVPFLPNVWLGTTVEDVARKSRIDLLRNVPARIRFLSIEPLLEDLGRLELWGIDLVIVGGESGHNARPCEVSWIRSVRDQCVAARVACFVKQLGSRPRCIGGVPGVRPQMGLKDPKGGDPSEWPKDLQVREMP